VTWERCLWIPHHLAGYFELTKVLPKTCSAHIRFSYTMVEYNPLRAHHVEVPVVFQAATSYSDSVQFMKEIREQVQAAKPRRCMWTCWYGTKHLKQALTAWIEEKESEKSE
jgi:hypothetical protein